MNLVRFGDTIINLDKVLWMAWAVKILGVNQSKFG
jgi:hypothetical protein